MISNSLEWSTEKERLKKKIQQLPFNNDLRKMVNNIDLLVIELSKAEVIDRRNKNNLNGSTQLKIVNDAIANLEKWIMMGALLQ